MKKTNIKTIYHKTLGFISISLLVLSFFLSYSSMGGFSYDISSLTFEYINTKDMASVTISEKEYPIGNTFLDILNPKEDSSIVTAVPMTIPGAENTATEPTSIPAQTWHLPTEIGYITDNVRRGHVAIDIASARGQQEIIYPVANGVVSAIYTDGYGAKIVIVNHNINGISYASQYVHLYRYASGLYVGKEVTINDALGLMGTTGYSTGVHLHISVVDCALGDSTCPDVNAYLKYLTTRYNQGFNGLPSLMNVPSSWSSR